eukprot:CAMPEP_0116010670 /NCGR_PEP_ID=MMETSP0321-20121206/4128_1 /TAXON_ID=163516 /ORGANISM="Leptocylindrus danicus var. danicus, Strain B650" /LENGTH=161 /DNA_ID=CAMNT_0003479791 /DNA_START=8 /DNA_END=489 /DNA_ORIENTATION=-
MTSPLFLRLICTAARIRTSIYIRQNSLLRLQLDSCRRRNERHGIISATNRTFSASGANSSTPSAPTSYERQPDDSSSTINNDSSITSIPKQARRDILSKVISIAKPEFPLIIASSLTLGITSSITLLLPYCSGQVIDLSILASSSNAGANGAFTPWEAAAG